MKFLWRLFWTGGSSVTSVHKIWNFYEGFFELVVLLLRHCTKYKIFMKAFLNWWFFCYVSAQNMKFFVKVFLNRWFFCYVIAQNMRFWWRLFWTGGSSVTSVHKIWNFYEGSFWIGGSSVTSVHKIWNFHEGFVNCVFICPNIPF